VTGCGTPLSALIPTLLLLLLLMLTEVLVETLTVLAAAAATAVCLGRGGGVGACRNCRGHNRGLSGPEPELLPPPPAAVTPLGPVRDDGGIPAELTTAEADCC